MNKHRLTRKRVEDLQEQVLQYEVTLTKIIPREVARQNDTLTEEIGVLMFQREWLEKDLRQYGAREELAPIQQRVKELDRILIEQRWMILDHARAYYEHERERLRMPREYWWWYLDDLEAAQLPEWVMARSTR